MIAKEEIENNINSEWQITLNYQKESRYGLCKFIIEVCQKIGLSNETASLAMLITNFFFIRKCYFNYDKLTTACAAILLASKTQSSQSKLNDICKEYSFTLNKIKKDSLPIYRPEETHKIKEQIGKYEIFLLKELNFNIPQEFPFDYVYVYSELLYPDNEQEIANFAIKVANDSYLTYANNIYKSYVVALSCLVIAARFLEIPTFLEDDFKYINNMKKINTKGISAKNFEKLLIQYDNQPNNNILDEEKKNENEKYFNSLNLCQKLHPELKMEQLLDCIDIIIKFYEDMNAKSNENNVENNKNE